ncbi:hypothetical protein C8Q74DRAFT_1443869 [Fomes fomentarius]|nr:hypothetical protein C8Q74DRAFT_1443869 [Fomes fomentarius]
MCHAVRRDTTRRPSTREPHRQPGRMHCPQRLRTSRVHTLRMKKNLSQIDSESHPRNPSSASASSSRTVVSSSRPAMPSSSRAPPSRHLCQARAPSPSRQPRAPSGPAQAPSHPLQASSCPPRPPAHPAQVPSCPSPAASLSARTNFPDIAFSQILSSLTTGKARVPICLAQYAVNPTINHYPRPTTPFHDSDLPCMNVLR